MNTVFAVAEEPYSALVKRIRVGLPASSFVQVARQLGLSNETLALKLGLTTRTIDRKRKAKQALSAEESEKVIRVARIWNAAKALFTTDEAISEWLRAPAAPLGGVPPIDLLDTDVGAADVEGFIKGLAYGNFQ